MGNNTSHPGLDSRSRGPPYRDRPRAYTTRGKKSKYEEYYDDDDDGYGEDYLPQVPYTPAGYPQMTYAPGPYLNAHGQYVPAQQMLFPQPQMQPGITPVVPGMGMNGAMPIAGNPFPGPAMNMGPTMPEPQVVVPPIGQTASVDGPVIPPPLPSTRRGRAATPYMHREPLDSSSDEDDDELTAEARARLQPPLRPGQYGPFDPVRARGPAHTPHPILQRGDGAGAGGGGGGRRHHRAASSPAYMHDSPPFDDPPQPPVIPPNFMGGPPFPNHTGVQPMPDWPPPPEMGIGMGGVPQPQPQLQPQQPQPELPPAVRPRPFEPIQRSNNPLPAPPRDILHSSPYARLLEDLRKPIDGTALKAKIAAAPAIHTLGAVNIAPQPVPAHEQRTRSGKDKDKEKKKKGLFRSLSSRLAGSGSGSSARRASEDSPPHAHAHPQQIVQPHMQTFVGGHAVAVYPVVQHMPDGSMALVYNHPTLGPDGVPISVPIAAAPPPPVLSPGSGGTMPGYVPSATPASAALNVVGMPMPPGPTPTPVLDPAAVPPLPQPRMPTPQPPRPLVKIGRTGELAGLLHFSAHRVHYGHRSYPTGAHLFEALKFMGGRDDLAERVRGCGTAEEAVAVAEGLREYWRADWDEVKVEMLENVLYNKFVQHGVLREMLMATGGADLVFADPDTVWGDGMVGQGLNLLGGALMRVRARLREEGLDT
ncbi:hypothetical protein GSI_01341 [Ganoderma sinense ZZ0214-1]|uniref:NADAR domain-containing protein n=1 Tax=Ganoderma sinense ZZ0214-1 TaxID=1077348 RepID=A0A2G8SV47_9APHY|nr:hypothetical protein GSI_01341 [Ganoderma sinense ZZ0214-1]